MNYTKDNILKYFFWIIFVSFILYFKLTYHELWKDEWQAWFVAKDMNFPKMLSFLYYEGHPALWYIYLKIASIFALFLSDLHVIQIAHLLTVVLGLYFLFVRFSMPLIYKILLASTYFLFFEYGVINRGYFLVISLLFWLIYSIKQENYSAKTVGILLFLLCQTEVYGAMMAVSLGLYIILSEKKVDFTGFTKRIEAKWLLAGAIVFVISIFPRSIGHVGLTKSKELSFIDQILSAFQGNLSNTYLVGSTKDTFTYGWTLMGLVLSVVCLGMIWFVFKNNKAILFTVFFFIASMIGFSTILYLGGIRQWGMGFVFLIGMLELKSWDDKKEILSSIFIATFCTFGMIHGWKAVSEDAKIPFTNAAFAGNFIKEKVPEKVPVVAINKFETTPVIGYARRKFYELPMGIEFSYFKWVEKIYLPTEAELKLFGKYKNVGGIIVISPRKLEGNRFPSLQLWQSFDAKNYKNENYYIYTLTVKDVN